MAHLLIVFILHAFSWWINLLDDDACTLPAWAILALWYFSFAHLYGDLVIGMVWYMSLVEENPNIWSVYHAPIMKFDAIDNYFYRVLTFFPCGFHAYYLMFWWSDLGFLGFTCHGFWHLIMIFEEHSTSPIIGFMTHTHCRFWGVVFLGHFTLCLGFCDMHWELW